MSLKGLELMYEKYPLFSFKRIHFDEIETETSRIKGY